jgi:hypothetical protein
MNPEKGRLGGNVTAFVTNPSNRKQKTLPVTTLPKGESGGGMLARMFMAASKEERLAVMRQYRDDIHREHLRRWFWSLSPEQQAEELARMGEDERAALKRR